MVDTIAGGDLYTLCLYAQECENVSSMDSENY